MIIALDFDLTYTRDPELWNDFIKQSQSRGHEVFCVTMRYPEEKFDIEDSIGKLCKIIYTKRFSKLQFVNDIGIYPDIWIDDNPYYIIGDDEKNKNKL